MYYMIRIFNFQHCLKRMKLKTYRGMQVYATLWCTNIDFKILPWFPLMIYIQSDKKSDEETLLWGKILRNSSPTPTTLKQVFSGEKLLWGKSALQHCHGITIVCLHKLFLSI